MNRLKWPLVVFGFWALLAVVLAAHATLFLRAARRYAPDAPGLGASFGEMLVLHLAEFAGWAVLTLIILALGRRFPLEQGRWPVGLLVHLPASLVCAALHTAFAAWVNHVLRSELPRPLASWEVFELYVLAKLPSGLFFYWTILLVGQAAAYYRKYRDRELRASQLEAQLARAQVQALQMQLHPHFLFNTLNAISALMHQDVEVADRMIARLGELLRAALDQAGTQEVPLYQELEFIKPYLEIEQARMGERLTVALDVAPEAVGAAVPNLLLQPLVENAIRHGIAPRAEPGRIEIRARRRDGLLEVQVCDDGPGLPPARQKEGVGLANTRARLRQLYGDRHRFELHNGPGRGLVVTVAVPFREPPADGAGEGGGEPARADR